MYDWNFSSSLGQIKTLSLITNSEFGMAMFHYFEGKRLGLGDPLNAENEYLKALKYFESQKDTSGILHTVHHLFRLSLNTTLLHFGDLTRYYTLYGEVLAIGSEAKDPWDQIIHLRNIIIYDEYICGYKNVTNYKNEIEKGLAITKLINSKYDYYKFLMLNAIGIVHSKSILYNQSEIWHLQAYDIIKKYPSLDQQMAAFRIASMKFQNGKYKESLHYLDLSREYHRRDRCNTRLIINYEAIAFLFKTYSQNYLKLGDVTNNEFYADRAYFFFSDIFNARRHELYMKDMAAYYKNEKNTTIIIENEKKQSSLNFILLTSVSLLGFLFYYIYLRRERQKLLEQEIRKKDFIYSLIGHDLSSPIIDMDIIIDHIETDLQDKLNTDQKNYLHQLRIKTQGANLLLMNLLDLYKEKKLYLNQKKIYPFIYIKDEINRSISHLFTNKIKNNVTIVNNCPDDLVHQIDRQSFQCVIRNIVDNALKHSQCDTITFHAEITFKGLVITIEDNGVGLPDDIAENFNLKKTIFDYSNGKTRIGLGTVFILEFVHALKSELKVESNHNGTKFILTLPRR
ncbi:MAG TPA: sensor histidine kinase [Saprospiraceae bacterium]|nr:sensor histidine kinase [Saprospiraceae bacterium]